MKMMIKGLGIAAFAVMFVFALTECKEAEEASPPPVASTPVDTVINISAIHGVVAPTKDGIPVTKIAENEQYSGTVTWNGNPFVFAKATVYTATITLTAKPGYTLQGVSANFFTVAIATSVSNDVNSGVITAVFPSTAAHIIDIAAIRGVTVPVKGEQPVRVITESEQYSGTVEWNNDPVTFAASTEYTATITLRLKEGFTSQGVTADFFTVEGAISVSNEADSGIITAVFPTTAAHIIDIAAIQGVTVPANGGVPVKIITENAQYSGTVTWNNNPSLSVFTGSIMYSATITLTPKVGYTLQGVSANFFKVVGATSVSNSANSGVITAVFPATAPTSTTSVTINIIAPVKGATQSTAEIVSSSTEGEINFDIGLVSWSPDDNPFLGNMVYTASVTLTAHSGYTFAGLSSATINGQNVAVSNNPSSTVTLSYTFPKTDEKTVSSIAIKNQPTKLTYTHGDTLDLTGLIVTLTHDDTSTEDVTAADFTAKNITANPAAGNHLIYSTHNNKPIMITYGSLTENTNNLTVNRATPTAADFNISGTGTFTYDGNTRKITIAPKEGKSNGTITVKYNNSTTVPSAVSTYTVTFDVSAAGDFNAASGLSAGTLTIGNATPVVADFIISGIGSFYYDGSSKIVIITPQAGKSTGAITVKYNGSTTAPSAVGTYTVTFDVGTSTNFNAVSGLSAGTLTIVNANPIADDFNISGIGTFTYDGSVKTVTITPKEGKSNGRITVKYNGSTTVPSAAGTYTVTFDVALTTGFNAVNGLSAGTLIIENATPTDEDYNINGIGTFTYNGSYKSVTITPKTGKSNGTRTLKYNDSTTAPSEVGVYTVTFDVAAVTNFNAANGLSAGTLTIINATPTAADFNISGIGSFYYDHSVKTVTITPKTGKSNGTRTLKYNDSTTAPSEVGVYTVTFDVAATTNYNAVNGLSAGTLTIEKSTPIYADFNINGIGSFFYDGSSRVVTITPKEGKSTGTITVKYNGSTTAPSAVGTYIVTFDVAAATGFNAVSGLVADILTIVKIEMVSIPAGTFMMGSPTTEPDRSDDEIQHLVTLSAFSMSKYLVTQAQYQAVMGTNPGNFGSGESPVERVNWYDALVFCNKLSIKEGLDPVYRIGGSTNPVDWGYPPSNIWNEESNWTGVVMDKNKNGYRLPTEAEWEYACRAGTTTPFNTGNNITTDQANYNGNYPYNGNAKGKYIGLTTPVGNFSPNAWDLYDMHGNVWEWCWDRYNEHYYSSSPENDPIGFSGGSYGHDRVLRGGSWYNSAKDLRSASRGNNNVHYSPFHRFDDVGFRLVRSN